MNLTAEQRISLNAAGVDDPLDCAEIVSAEDWKTVSDIARRHDGGEALTARHLKRLAVTSHAILGDLQMSMLGQRMWEQWMLFQLLMLL